MSRSWQVPESLSKLVGLVDITDEIKRTGVYFICRGGGISYIGQSSNAVSRAGSSLRRFWGDTCYFLPCPEKDMGKIEAAFIRVLQPSANKTYSRRGGESLQKDIKLLASISLWGNDIIVAEQQSCVVFDGQPS